jgi:hypothetical protein
MRRWLVEEVATEEEASKDAFGIPRVFEDDDNSRDVFVKITEQKEEREQPERWVPGIGELYYTDCGTSQLRYVWEDDELDLRLLKKGRVFQTKEECQAYIDR